MLVNTVLYMCIYTYMCKSNHGYASVRNSLTRSACWFLGIESTDSLDKLGNSLIAFEAILEANLSIPTNKLKSKKKMYKKL